ncbi:hypothetical protein [Chryseobacterium sp.]|uniref:hypothetical protein n=1 Tax=unclassified Chryseobacterium TaxID=2593645 RepID=UPI0028965275|nr:hypothetical protein [Chryseobacterium sp.]
MKKLTIIIIGIIAVLGIVVIAKNNYVFSFGDRERLDKGWKAYEGRDYSFAITQFVSVDLKDHPEVVMPLADSYLEIGEAYNAIQYLEPAYHGKNYSADERSKITNMLGIAYTKEKNYKKARLFLEESNKLGNPNSKRNLQILDSLEQTIK